MLGLAILSICAYCIVLSTTDLSQSELSSRKTSNGQELVLETFADLSDVFFVIRADQTVVLELQVREIVGPVVWSDGESSVSRVVLADELRLKLLGINTSDRPQLKVSSVSRWVGYGYASCIIGDAGEHTFVCANVVGIGGVHEVDVIDIDLTVLDLLPLDASNLVGRDVQISAVVNGVCCSRPWSGSITQCPICICSCCWCIRSAGETCKTISALRCDWGLRCAFVSSKRANNIRLLLIVIGVPLQS